MCGRYNYRDDFTIAIAALHGVDEIPPLKVPRRYNMAPRQTGPVILQSDERSVTVKEFRWGLLPPWSKDEKFGDRCINARADTVHNKPSFRGAFRGGRRCLVVADGYYEWQQSPHGKLPWRFSRIDGQPMMLAGLWESWQPPEQTVPLNTFTIITTEANMLAGRVHDRMPVILPQQDWQAWIDPRSDPARLHRLLCPFDDRRREMEVYRVTTKMNSARFESAECVARLPEVMV